MTTTESDIDFVAEQIVEAMRDGRIVDGVITPKPGPRDYYQRARTFVHENPGRTVEIRDCVNVLLATPLIAAIEDAPNLVALQAALRYADEYARGHDLEPEDIYQTHDIPNFGGVDPDEPGIYSWDKESMLAIYDEWSIIPRPEPEAGPVQRVVLHDPHAGL